MSFTYKPNELKKNKVSQVRLNIGNTKENDLVSLEDEEIEFFLETSFDHVTDASIKAINALINKAGEIVDKTTGQVQESASQLINNLIRSRDDMLNSISRNVPSKMGFTGMFNDDRQEVQEDDKIYQDGLDMKTESPATRLLISPVDGTT